MQLANIVRERWKGVLFCLIIAIPATLLGKQIEAVSYTHLYTLYTSCQMR